MAKLFEWPIPPYFAVVDGDEYVGPEECLVQLRNGDRIAGKLVSFALSESCLTVLPDDATASRTLDLEQVRSVRLLRTLRIGMRKTPLDERAVELFVPSARQNYSVEFPDNEVIKGDTVGYVNTRQGLFLFVPTDDDRILRHFYPRVAMRQYRIGLPIGEILVEEKVVKQEEVDTALARQREMRALRIGDYLTEHRVVSQAQLALAIKHQEGKPMLRLGEALVQLGLINPQQLEAALTRQRQDRSVPLGRILLGMGLVDEGALKDVLARKLGIPHVGLAGFNFDPEAVRLVGSSLARKHVLMPLCIHEGALVIAFEDPLDAGALEEVAFTTQKRIIPAMASHEEIWRAITDELRRVRGDAPGRTREGCRTRATITSSITPATWAWTTWPPSCPGRTTRWRIADDTAAAPETVLMQLVNKMIMDAWSDGVSDIHIESYPGKKATRVRFRKDGVLVDYTEVPASSRNMFISRIKVMTQLDISERRKPQDGKLDFRQFGPAEIELRVATIPTANGLEDIVMRLLAASELVRMADLGLAPDVLAHLTRVVERPYGLVLACGPTGSGKTTTLHSLLGHINTPGRKIWTAEDPIEITQPGLRQVQVNAKIGWTFAAAMRTFLRADPDVIMVGEMRDAETAKAGLEASLTGHLVLSTLHTNSAPESVTRLLDLGMDPFNFADALLAVLAQRLARTLCPHCRQRHTPDAAELEELAAEYCEGTDARPDATLKRWHDESAASGGVTLYRAAGCARCNGTGHHGRVGLHELLVMTPILRHLVQTRAPMAELKSAALAGGMRTLKQDGIAKVLRGLTDIGQVRAVC